MTSEVELPPEITSPPVVLNENPLYPVGGIFKFNASVGNELRIRVQIRDEDTAETLKARWRVKSGTKPYTMFDCTENSENTISGTGLLVREFDLFIERLKLERGACNKVEFVVSPEFLSCKQQLFDVTVPEGNLGRATYWIWEMSGEPPTPTESQILVNTCETIDMTNVQPTMESQ